MFQGVTDTSVVVLIVLFLLLNLCAVCISYVYFHMQFAYLMYILVKSRQLSGHLLGNSYSPNLQYVCFVLVPDSHLRVFGVELIF